MTTHALHQNAPNPFGGWTTIGFELPAASAVRLEIYDVAGRRVRTLATEELPAGRHALVWDRRDGEGRAVPAGIYLYRVQAAGHSDRRRMVLAP